MPCSCVLVVVGGLVFVWMGVLKIDEIQVCPRLTVIGYMVPESR